MAHYALKKRPRTNTRALSDCVCIRADGSTYVIPRTPAPDAETLAARERQNAINAKLRQRARDNAKVDAMNAIERRTHRTSYKLESIHDPRGY